MKLSPESYLGGCSIYGGQFEDENLGWNDMQQSGLVCMANRGPATNSNGSQFFITVSRNTIKGIRQVMADPDGDLLNENS